MKALSLKQPRANRVAEGKKMIETRKRKTNYRGDLLICSSRTVDIAPAGYALCVVELVDIEPMRKEHEHDACIEVYEGAYARHLRNLRVLKEPFPVKGQLNIFEVDVDVKTLQFVEK